MKKLITRHRRECARGRLAAWRIARGLAVPGTTTRADAYVEIWCDSDPTNLDGTGPGSITPGNSAPEGGAEDDVLAKRVDARAIQPEKDPGGKDTATERFNATAGVVQGWFCGEA